MFFDLLLFDLDDTLIRSADLEPFRGVENTGRVPASYVNDLRTQARSRGDRIIYSGEFLAGLRRSHPQLRFAVFTCSPRVYASTLLDLFYPDFPWDAVVAYEDVARTKPHPDGVISAMRATGIEQPWKVVLVGDGVNDVTSAYRAGCWAFLDTTTWPAHRSQTHWRTLKMMPDAVFRRPNGLARALEHPQQGMPLFERLIHGDRRVESPEGRIERINHFPPCDAPENGIHLPIDVMGRLFSDYGDLDARRSWSAGTHSVLEHKDANEFPEAWVRAVRMYLERQPEVVSNQPAILTVIPAKPGRTPRLERLLTQIQRSHREIPIRGATRLAFQGVLQYRDGAQSHHGNHLGKSERFNNVRENLFVHPESNVRGKHVFVIDDVATTGASLYFADWYLSEAGAASVRCMALTKAISM